MNNTSMDTSQSTTMQQSAPQNINVCANQKMSPNPNMSPVMSPPSPLVGVQSQQTQQQQQQSTQQSTANNSQTPNTPTSIPEIIFTGTNHVKSNKLWIMCVLLIVFTINCRLDFSSAANEISKGS